MMSLLFSTARRQPSSFEIFSIPIRNEYVLSPTTVKTRQMKRLIILIIVVVLLAVAGFGGWVYNDLRKPFTHAKTGQYIEIPRGSSPSAIISKLTAEGVLKNEWPLKF